LPYRRVKIRFLAQRKEHLLKNCYKNAKRTQKKVIRERMLIEIGD
jgi:hypothetical protein